MRYLLIFLTVFLFTNCEKKEVKDTSQINDLLAATDSLYQKITVVYNENLNALYNITEDSLLADVLSKNIVLPDSVGFYQFLALNINEINETYYLSQREIIFTQDQLISLKQELRENEISDSLYLESIEREKEIMKFLQERIDTNIFYIKSKYDLVLRVTIKSND